MRKTKALLFVLAALTLTACNNQGKESTSTSDSAPISDSTSSGKASSSSSQGANITLTDSMFASLAQGVSFDGYAATKVRLSSSLDASFEFEYLDGKSTQTGYWFNAYAASMLPNRTAAEELSVANLNTEILKYKKGALAGRTNYLPSATLKTSTNKPVAVSASLSIDNTVVETPVENVAAQEEGSTDTEPYVAFSESYSSGLFSALHASDFAEDTSKRIAISSKEKAYVLNITDTTSAALKAASVAFNYFSFGSNLGVEMKDIYVVTDGTKITKLIGDADTTIVMNFMGQEMKILYTAYSYLNVTASGSDVTVKNTEALTTTPDTALDTLFKSMKNGNYTENATLTYVTSNTTYNYSWTAKETASTYTYTSEVTQNGKKATVSNQNIILQKNNYLYNLKTYGDKGTYATSSSGTALPKFDLDAHFFTKQADGSFVFKASDYADIILTYDTTDFTYGDSFLLGKSTISEITVKVEEGGFELKTTGSVVLKTGDTFTTEFDIHYSAIGTTTDGFDATDVKTTSDDLTWKDLFSSDTNYSKVCTNVGGEDFLLKNLPTMGGSFFEGTLGAFGASEDDPTFGFMVLYEGSDDMFTEDYISSLISSMKKKFEAVKLSDGTAAFSMDAKSTSTGLLMNYKNHLTINSTEVTLQAQVFPYASMYGYYWVYQVICTPVTTTTTTNSLK